MKDIIDALDWKIHPHAYDQLDSALLQFISIVAVSSGWYTF